MSNGIQQTFALEEPITLWMLRFFIVGAEDGGKFKFVSGTKSVFLIETGTFWFCHVLRPLIEDSSHWEDFQE